MADYVVYHNPERMGGPFAHGTGEYAIVTGKPQVRSCVGDTVWIVQGSWVSRGGKKVRLYTLECRFVIDAAEEMGEPDFSYRGTGEQGTTFVPPILLNGLPWFNRFYDLQNNFSYGFRAIDPKTLRHLHTLTAGR